MGWLATVGSWIRDVVREVGISGLVDIAVMAVLIRALLVWLKRTKRAAAAVTGILIVAGVYLLARQFDLNLTAAVLHGFFAVFLVALVVIFQQELRYLFERVAQWSLDRGKRQQGAPRSALEQRIGILVRTLTDLARERWGAIIVLRGADPVVRHSEGGLSLNGDLSEAILKSVFDPHSLGHDGAVIVEGGVIRRFACHLPLSRNLAAVPGGGTRHAAALGLSERTDALCFVVSEERGTISVARHGELRPVALASLGELLARFYAESGPGLERRGWVAALRAHGRETLVAIGLALALWFVLVHESRVVLRTYRIPVDFGPAAPGLHVAERAPIEVEVAFSGPRKSFYFMRTQDVRMASKIWNLEAGRTTLSLGAADFVFPEGLTFESAWPRQVELRLGARGGPEPPDGP
jgi:uncharacterized protein (TIGR00159 family)